MSITLTTPVSFTIGGVTENDTIGALTSLTQDFQGNIQTAVYNIGTAIAGTPPALNQGAAAAAIVAQLRATFDQFVLASRAVSGTVV